MMPYPPTFGGLKLTEWDVAGEKCAQNITSYSRKIIYIFKLPEFADFSLLDKVA